MVVLPPTYSVKLPPKISVHVSCLAPTTSGKYFPTTANETVHPKPGSVVFRELSVWHARQQVVDDQTRKRSRGEKDRERRLRLERGVESAILRLEDAAKRVVELETEKSLSKVRGSISCEERNIAEETSWEIMRQFLEEPIRNLRSRDGCMEEKMKVVEMIIDGMVEESCLGR